MSATAGTSASAIAAKRETYLKHLLTQASAAADESGLGLKVLREKAIAQLSGQSFPSGRDEAWRFTDLSDMLALPFQRAIAADSSPTSRELKSSVSILDDSYRIASVNGHYDVSLSSIPPHSASKSALPAGVIIAPLSDLMAHAENAQKITQIITHKLAQIEGDSEIFTALNTAGFSEVLVIWIPAEQVIETPICIVRAAQGEAVSHLRSLIIAERNASCTIVESFWGDDTHSRFNNSVSEFWLEDGAQVNHIRVQTEGAKTFHLAKTAVSQAANSRYSCTAIDFGAQLSRHHLEIYQQGPQTDTHLYGLSALRLSQLADTHSLISLAHPYSSATQIQKNIVDDRAHAVFNGKVTVSRAAQLTNAAQLNRNLMLSNKARIDTKPELDIVADNVKCAHGATVSQLQADELFYLQSRGISSEQAQRLLIYGFAMEIVEKISIEPLRLALSDSLGRLRHRINQTMTSQ
jgi:Fe-S cluster assembly protein SufD